MMRRRTYVAFGLLAVACQPSYDRLEFTILSSGSDTVEIDAQQLVLPVGTAVAVQVAPQASGVTKYEAYHVVEMTSQDDDVMMVRGGYDLDVFVLVGVSVGEASIDVTIRDEWVDTIEGRVTP